MTRRASVALRSADRVRAGDNRGSTDIGSSQGHLQRSAKLSFGILLALLALCVLGGGSSKSNVLSLLYVRPAAVLALAFFVWQKVDWRLIQPAGLLLAALALLYALQLLPLPPGIWHALPGHGTLVDLQKLNGTADDWRPMSIDPDATRNALISLVVPLAVLVGLGAIGEKDRRRLLVPVIGVLLAGALLGLVQVAGGQGSPFYLYRDTYPGYAVGWFSNRNHHAVALACLFPLLRWWAASDDRRLSALQRHAIAAVVAILILPLIIITGSRAGLAIAGVALILSLVMLPPPATIPRRTLLIAVGGVLGVVLMLAAAMLALGRAAAFDRLFQSQDLGSEGRIAYLTTEWQILSAFWPWGVGGGAFDPAIRMFEPDTMLRPTYFNHAHNDFLEMALVGGLPAILLVLSAVLLAGWWTVRVFRPWRRPGLEIASGRAGAVMLWLVAAASLVDYPVRAPLMAAFMMIAVIWLRSGAKSR